MRTTLHWRFDVITCLRVTCVRITVGEVTVPSALCPSNLRVYEELCINLDLIQRGVRLA